MSDVNDFGLDDETGALEGSGYGVGVVRIGKRDYAVGLFWNTVTSDAKREAREMAASSKVSADFYCVRNGGTTQFGLGFKENGHKSAMPSLAAHLASSKSGSWLGIFEVPGGYYLVAVRDDGILAECDRFIESSEQVTETFLDFQGQSDWNECIAPESLGISDTKEVDITAVLDGRPPSRLTEVSRSGNIMKLGLAVILIGGVLGGGMYYLDSVEQARIQAELQRTLEQATSLVRPEEKAIERPPMPWEGKPIGRAILEGCVKNVARFPADIPGWNVTQIICKDNNFAAVLTRRGTLGENAAPVTWIETAIKKEGYKFSLSFAPEGSGNIVGVNWSTDPHPKIPVDLGRVRLSDIRNSLIRVLESRMTPVSLGEADSNDFWRGMTFKFSTSERLEKFADLIAALPGAIITRIQFDVVNAEWELEGTIYEQLDPPQPTR